MPINTLALATKMTTELDKAVVQKSATGFFTDNAMRAKFVGANIVLIPRIELQGLGDYDRDSGFAQGSITVNSYPLELKMDRGRSFLLDAQDADETGIPGLAGQVMGEFVRTKVIPELDAYVLSMLGKYADVNNQTVLGTMASEAYKMFTNACNKIYNELGYEEELVCFVNSAMWAALQNSPEFTRQITISDFSRGGVDTKVKSINGIPLIPVPDTRMKTEYTFYDGKSPNQISGGFTPTQTAKSIGLLLLPKRAVALVKKTEKVRIFDPDKNQQADAWKFDYRIYYDAFIKDSLKKGVVAYVSQ